MIPMPKRDVYTKTNDSLRLRAAGGSEGYSYEMVPDACLGIPPDIEEALRIRCFRDGDFHDPFCRRHSDAISLPLDLDRTTRGEMQSGFHVLVRPENLADNETSDG